MTLYGNFFNFMNGGGRGVDIFSLFNDGANPGSLLDLTTLSGVVFQDDDQTAASAGDPVGLVLPNGGAIYKGSRLESNGDFDTDATDWSVGDGLSATVSGGVVTLERLSTGTGLALQQSVTGLEVGRWYKVEVVITGVSVDAGNCFITAFNVNYPFGNTPGTYTFYRRADSTARLVGAGIGGAASAGSTLSIDSISVTEVNDMWNQITSADRPVLRNDGTNNYLEFNGTNHILATGSGALDLSSKNMLLGHAIETSDTRIPLWGETNAGSSIFAWSTGGGPNTPIANGTINNVYINGSLDTTGAKDDRLALGNTFVGEGKTTVVLDVTWDATAGTPPTGEDWIIGFSGNFSGFYGAMNLYASAWVVRTESPTAGEIAAIHNWLNARM